MKEDIENQAEKIEQDPTVRRELNRTGGRIKQTVTRTADKFLIVTHAILLLALGAFYFLLGLKFFGFATRYVPSIGRLTLAAMAVILVLAIRKLIDVFFIGRIENPV